MGYTTSPKIFIITEYVAGGDLFSLLRSKEGRRLLPREKLQFALDVARGMAYLHSQEPPVIHRDLKSENVLVVWNAKQRRRHLKIVDFGLARVKEMDSKGGTQQMTQAGTPYWTAPEVLILLGCLYMQRVITITLQCC